VFRFDWFFKSRSSLELQRRCDALIRWVTVFCTWRLSKTHLLGCETSTGYLRKKKKTWAQPRSARLLKKQNRLPKRPRKLSRPLPRPLLPKASTDGAKEDWSCCCCCCLRCSSCTRIMEKQKLQPLCSHLPSFAHHHLLLDFVHTKLSTFAKIHRLDFSDVCSKLFVFFPPELEKTLGPTESIGWLVQHVHKSIFVAVLVWVLWTNQNTIRKEKAYSSSWVMMMSSKFSWLPRALIISARAWAKPSYKCVLATRLCWGLEGTLFCDTQSARAKIKQQTLFCSSRFVVGSSKAKTPQFSEKLCGKHILVSIPMNAVNPRAQKLNLPLPGPFE